ncbi:MAG TPA: hypothetical protein GX395_07860 [Clostridia bacterium]|jgi:hypothetical protein|nr:hypothetical protein [Clostridia bacterium]HPZ71412.1 hypothetical protein [Peptococcaceae bacterium]
MKKKTIVIGLLVLFMLTFAGCNPNATEPRNDQGDNGEITADPNTNTGSDNGNKIELEYTEEGVIKPEIAEKVIKDTATKVMTTIKEKDFAALAGFVHPEKGVRFTPYTYVNVENDLVFKREELKGFFNDQKKYMWGYYDGTGDEITLTPTEYYAKFIYTADFLNAEQVGYNEVLSYGNMLENQFEVYPQAIVAEYYFSGFNPDYAGMDWQSLRLVFQEHNEAWYLVGIIHNQWTI